jgi:uncharacterized membrane protein YccC
MGNTKDSKIVSIRLENELRERIEAEVEGPNLTRKIVYVLSYGLDELKKSRETAQEPDEHEGADEKADREQGAELAETVRDAEIERLEKTIHILEANTEDLRADNSYLRQANERLIELAARAADQAHETTMKALPDRRGPIRRLIDRLRGGEAGGTEDV